MRSPLKIPCATPAWGAWSLWTMSHPSQKGHTHKDTRQKQQHTQQARTRRDSTVTHAQCTTQAHVSHESLHHVQLFLKRSPPPPRPPSLWSHHCASLLLSLTLSYSLLLSLTLSYSLLLSLTLSCSLSLSLTLSYSLSFFLSFSLCLFLSLSLPRSYSLLVTLTLTYSLSLFLFFPLLLSLSHSYNLRPLPSPSTMTVLLV